MAYTTIDKPSDYFDTKVYTGTQSNNITLTMDNVGWVWMKNRTNSGNNILMDVVRGGNNSNSQKPVLVSNTSGAEQGSDITATGGVAFGSTSTVIGSDNGGYNYNNSTSSSYVAWHWGTGTSFTNSAGANGASIASTGSVNTDSGFSIVSWTSPNSNVNTIAHGLGAVPKMIIMKKRGAAGGWITYHQAMGNTHGMFLSTANAQEDNAAFFNDTSPTSTVFTTGTDAGLINNTMMAYCFAEKTGFNKFGSYVGNGAASDGPFSYTGFKPAFVMTKPSTRADDWRIFDNKRSSSGANPNNKHLFAHNNNAESASSTNSVPDGIDFLSNGFKIRQATNGLNSSGDTYIYMAFAENPFVTSTGVPATAR